MTSTTHDDNLLTLANFLDTLPDTAPFSMLEYTSLGYDCPAEYALGLAPLPCNTAACAVGYGPPAGLPAVADDLSVSGTVIDWRSYSERVFGSSSGDVEFEWMFGGSWSRTDNTPQGAAKRIHYYLAHGIPLAFDDNYDPEIYQ